MGRSRIRRGYSLEVIFEEDSDLCSNHDSLDSIAIRFGVQDTDDTISVDSLVEDYQSFYEKTDKNHVFQSADGVWDISSMDTCVADWEEFFIASDTLSKMPPGGLIKSEFDPRKTTAADVELLNGRRNCVSRRQIVQANWACTKDMNGRIQEQVNEDASRVIRTLPIDIRLDSKSDNKIGSLIEDHSFTLDPCMSSRADENEGNADTFPELDTSETASAASTACTSSTSSSPTSNSRACGKQTDFSLIQPYNNSDYKDPELGTTDVKKVRALFEACSRKSSLEEDGVPSDERESNCQRIYSKNPASPTLSNSIVGGVHKRLKQIESRHDATNKVLHSAYSQLMKSDSQLNFSELLINDQVIIEDSPEPRGFQTMRHRRHNKKEKKDGGFSTLRRSHSMGTGLAAIEASLYSSDHSLRASKTNILAEEMPAPDTVKNVRTVFEQILQSRNSDPNKGISIVKKSLRSVKSCPSSKIYRSESMREDFPCGNESASLIPNRRYGKPILMKDYATLPRSSSISPVPDKSDESSKHIPATRQVSAPLKFAPRVNSPARWHDEVDISQHSHSPTTPPESLVNYEDDGPPKFISPEVLQRIRSCGSSTTYFGGRVIAQQNGKGKSRRHLSASRRHTLMGFQLHPSEDFHHVRSNTPRSNNATTPTANPIPMPRKSILSRDELDGVLMRNRDINDYEISLEGDKVIVPLPKLLPRRVSPELEEDVFSLGSKSIDTTPRIISVVPKSPSSSPTKSGSPAGSVIEGRGTPEGCEGRDTPATEVSEHTSSPHDGNNNKVANSSRTRTRPIEAINVHTDTEEGEGAWF